MKDFESILAKARKLAALADPAKNPEEAERVLASKAFNDFCERHGITPDSLDESKREWRTIYCKSRFNSNPIRLDDGLKQLCLMCLGYTTGDVERVARSYKTEIELPTKGLKIKLARVYAVEAQVTELEYQDWRDCFEHYASDFIELSEKRKAAAKQAAYDYRNAWIAFCLANNIQPPPDNLPPPDIKKALRGLLITGCEPTSPWGKGNKLTDGTPLLTL